MPESLSWAIDATPDERRAFSSLETCFGMSGERINESTISRLERVSVAGRFYYLKVYHLGGRHLRRFIGRSRVRAEWQNAGLFARLGIPSSRAVAFGEQSRLASGDQGIVVTEEIPDAVDLEVLATRYPERLRDAKWMNQVISRLAGYVRALHENSFVHNDLKFRNVLVDFSCDPEVYIIDCPMGRRMSWPLLQRGIVKDLACPDRMARRYLSRSQRLMFFKRYHQTARLTASQRRQLVKIHRFLEGRH